MFWRVLSGIFTFIFAFNLGAAYNQPEEKTDSELQQKVQEHMDVIVDESAAIVDDVIDEIRQNEHVQEAEQFKDDVNEIIEDTVNDIHEHFGDEQETEEEPVEAVTEEAVEEVIEEDVTEVIAEEETEA